MQNKESKSNVSYTNQNVVVNTFERSDRINKANIGQYKKKENIKSDDNQIDYISLTQSTNITSLMNQKSSKERSHNCKEVEIINTSASKSEVYETIYSNIEEKET